MPIPHTESVDLLRNKFVFPNMFQNKQMKSQLKTEQPHPHPLSTQSHFPHSSLQTGQHASISVINNLDQLKQEWQWHTANSLLTTMNKSRRYWLVFKT